MNAAQKIIKNTFSLIFSGAITQLLGLIAVVYLARVLGPGDFGKINFAIAFSLYFTLFANLGLPLLGTREIARDKGKINEYSGNIFTLRLCLSVLSFGLLLLTTFFLNKFLEIKYLIILYGLGVISSALLLDWVFQGVEKMEYVGFGRILAGIVSTGLVLLFIKTPEQLLLIPCFQVIGSILMAGVFILIFVKNFGKLILNFNFISWKKLLRQAMPLGISMIMAQGIYNIDTIMLGFMRNDVEIGYYNAAYKIILSLIMFGCVYFDAIFPAISNYYKTSLELLEKLQSYTVKLMVTLVLPLAVGGTIIAQPIMNLFYGPKYTNGVIAFQILIWLIASNSINMIYGRGLWACNKQNRFLMIVTIQVLVKVILSLILIPPLGIKGAAIANVCADVLGLFLCYIEFSKIVSVPFVNYIFKPLFVSILMGFYLNWALHGLSLNIFLLISSGMFIYSILLYLIGGITNKDIRLLFGLVVNRNVMV